MTPARNRWLLLVACLTLSELVPRPASAQTAQQLSGLRSSNLQTVYVLDRSGAETSGKLLGLNPESIVLLVDGAERRFDMANVARIQKRDSLKNGALIGAVVGLAMGFVTAGISDCPGYEPGGSCSGFRAVTFATSVGMYAAMGTGIDALVRGRSTIYAAPSVARTRSLQFDSPDPRAALKVGFSW